MGNVNEWRVREREREREKGRLGFGQRWWVVRSCCCKNLEKGFGMAIIAMAPATCLLLLVSLLFLRLMWRPGQEERHGLAVLLTYWSRFKFGPIWFVLRKVDDVEGRGTHARRLVRNQALCDSCAGSSHHGSWIAPHVTYQIGARSVPACVTLVVVSFGEPFVSLHFGFWLRLLSHWLFRLSSHSGACIRFLLLVPWTLLHLFVLHEEFVRNFELGELQGLLVHVITVLAVFGGR